MGMDTASVTRAALSRWFLCVAAALGPCLLGAAPIPVRFAEGSIHGFLVLRTQDGQFLAQGELLEMVRDADIQKTMTFRFKDGSLFEEKVVFSQQGAYLLKSYRLEQRGPAFAEDTTISLERATGRYRVQVKAHKAVTAKLYEGALDLPADVYNGMITTVARDLAEGKGETVHYVAFTPEPRLIQLDITPAGGQKIMVGDVAITAIHYVLKARLGPVVKILARLFGQTPEDGHVWIVDGDVPALVGFEGQLGGPADPIWRIELVSPAVVH